MPPRRKLFDPQSNEPFAISRSGLEQFMRCPRCFYQHQRLGVSPPKMVPLTLAVATDALLKNEFDAIRGSDAKHHVWKTHGLNVTAYAHRDIELWRNNFKGIRVFHQATNLEVFGAVDDVWQHDETSELHIVDYKSTSKKGDPSIDEGGFGEAYKRQMEIYQWLFGAAGHKVSPLGYFLYVNGLKEGGFYNSKNQGVMNFKTTMIEYVGDYSWVEEVIKSAKDCLMSEVMPVRGAECDNCRYFEQRQTAQSNEPS